MPDKKRNRGRGRVRAKVGLGLGQVVLALGPGLEQVVLAFLTEGIPSQADEQQALRSMPEVEVLRRAGYG